MHGRFCIFVIYVPEIQNHLFWKIVGWILITQEKFQPNYSNIMGKITSEPLDPLSIGFVHWISMALPRLNKMNGRDHVIKYGIHLLLSWWKEIKILSGKQCMKICLLGSYVNHHNLSKGSFISMEHLQEHIDCAHFNRKTWSSQS